MRCLNCHYDLSASPAGPCPECGRAFDPAKPETFQGPPNVALERALAWGVLGCSLPPVISLAFIHAALVAARIALGRWPDRWGGDDPWEIDGIEILLGGAQIAMVMVPLSFFGALSLLLGLTLQRARRAIGPAIVFVAIWGGSVAIFRWDPAEAVLWFFD